jgi:hypothetical protein
MNTTDSHTSITESFGQNESIKTVYTGDKDD